MKRTILFADNDPLTREELGHLFSGLFTGHRYQGARDAR